MKFKFENKQYKFLQLSVWWQSFVREVKEQWQTLFYSEWLGYIFGAVLATLYICVMSFPIVIFAIVVTRKVKSMVRKTLNGEDVKGVAVSCEEMIQILKKRNAIRELRGNVN